MKWKKYCRTKWLDMQKDRYKDLSVQCVIKTFLQRFEFQQLNHPRSLKLKFHLSLSIAIDQKMKYSECTTMVTPLSSSALKQEVENVFAQTFNYEFNG